MATRIPAIGGQNELLLLLFPKEPGQRIQDLPQRTTPVILLLRLLQWAKEQHPLKSSVVLRMKNCQTGGRRVGQKFCWNVNPVFAKETETDTGIPLAEENFVVWWKYVSSCVHCHYHVSKGMKKKRTKYSRVLSCSTVSADDNTHPRKMF